MNNCTFVGRLTADVEQKTTTNGTAVCTFTLAVDRDTKEKTTDFIPCVAWKQSAEFLARYSHKGDVVSAVGSLYSRKYEKDGKTFTVWEVNADRVRVVSSVQRAEKKEEPMIEVDTDAGLPF